MGTEPGYLAQHLLEHCANIYYRAFNFLAAMHKLSKSKLITNELNRADYILGGLKQPDWIDQLKQYDTDLHQLKYLWR